MRTLNFYYSMQRYQIYIVDYRLRIQVNCYQKNVTYNNPNFEFNDYLLLFKMKYY